MSIRLLLMTAVALMVTACSNDDERLFDDSAAQRMNQTIAECRQLLEASEHGWAMDYYPADGTWGGYAMTATFKDGMVTLRSEVTYTDGTTYEQYEAGTPMTSVYEMKGEQGAILSFDTYNIMIHYWSEPISDSSPDGCGGDCEFMLMSMGNNELVFRGKKHGNTMRLVRLTEPADDYITKTISNHVQLKQTPRLRLLAGDKTVGMSIANTMLTLNEPADDGTTTLPITYTANGLRLYNPIVVNGVRLSEFQLDDDGNLLAADGSQASMPYPTLGEIFLGYSDPWHFDYYLTKKQFNMCDELKELLTTAEKEAESQYYWNKFVGMTLGASTAHAKGLTNYPQCIGWDVMRYYAWEPLYVSYDVEFALNANDEVTISPIGAGAYFAPTNNPNYNGMLTPLVNYLLEKAPYRVTEGGTDGLRLESAADASCWFCLTAADPHHWFD